LVGAGVVYGAAVAEAQTLAGQQVFVIGRGNSAGQATMHLARYAEQVTILIRSDSLTQSMSDYLIREIDAARNVNVRPFTAWPAERAPLPFETSLLREDRRNDWHDPARRPQRSSLRSTPSRQSFIDDRDRAGQVSRRPAAWPRSVFPASSV
jgi:cation diffusion facilitator CzcD-associated flavoprotein CzcO